MTGGCPQGGGDGWGGCRHRWPRQLWGFDFPLIPKWPWWCQGSGKGRAGSGRGFPQPVLIPGCCGIFCCRPHWGSYYPAKIWDAETQRVFSSSSVLGLLQTGLQVHPQNFGCSPFLQTLILLFLFPFQATQHQSVPKSLPKNCPGLANPLCAPGMPTGIYPMHPSPEICGSHL